MFEQSDSHVDFGTSSTLGPGGGDGVFAARFLLRARQTLLEQSDSHGNFGRRPRGRSGKRKRPRLLMSKPSGGSTRLVLGESMGGSDLGSGVVFALGSRRASCFVVSLSGWGWGCGSLIACREMMWLSECCVKMIYFIVEETILFLLGWNFTQVSDGRSLRTELSTDRIGSIRHMPFWGNPWSEVSFAGMQWSC